MKVCRLCGTSKSLESFAQDKRYRLGIAGWCDACRTRKRHDSFIASRKFRIEKTCSVCYATKPITEFGRRTSAADGHRSACKACRNRSDMISRMSEPDRLLKSRLKHGYGMTPRDLRDMFDSQNGCCAICNNHMTRPTVDHDHSTGRVRALLCNSCNTKIGPLEDPVFVSAAMRYIEFHRTHTPQVAFYKNAKHAAQLKRRAIAVKALADA